MRTPAQIEASKRNGARSNGPTTTEGRAKSSQNAIRHGLTSHKVIVIDGESKEEWETFQREFLLKFQPRDFVEERIVIEMAVCRWRLERVWAMQTAALNQGITDALPVVEEQFEEYDVALVQAWAHIARKPDLQGLDQHETRLSRRFDRALRNLNELRAQYPSQPEPEFLADNQQPAAPEPAANLENAKLPNEPKPGIHVIYPSVVLPQPGPAAGAETSESPDSPRIEPL
jgi:hypothetical protein